jgi:hypothetical protein
MSILALLDALPTDKDALHFLALLGYNTTHIHPLVTVALLGSNTYKMSLATPIPVVTWMLGLFRGGYMLIFGHKATTKFGFPFNFGLAQVSYSPVSFSQKFISFEIPLPVATFRPI